MLLVEHQKNYDEESRALYLYFSSAAFLPGITYQQSHDVITTSTQRRSNVVWQLGYFLQYWWFLKYLGFIYNTFLDLDFFKALIRLQFKVQRNPNLKKSWAIRIHRVVNSGALKEVTIQYTNLESFCHGYSLKLKIISISIHELENIVLTPILTFRRAIPENKVKVLFRACEGNTLRRSRFERIARLNS